MEKSKFEGVLSQIKSGELEYKGLTLEHLKEAAEYIFNNTSFPKPDRVVKLIRSCKTYGTILDSNENLEINICNDKECTSYQDMLNLFKKQP